MAAYRRVYGFGHLVCELTAGISSRPIHSYKVWDYLYRLQYLTSLLMVD